MKIVIPSYMRADAVTTTKVIANSILCVPKCQEEQYKEHNVDAEIVSHPDHVVGISKKRQWILEKFGDCFQVDDDLIAVRRTYLGPGEKKDKLTSTETRDLMLDIYNSLKINTDIKLFGFAKSASPLHFDASKPISLNGFIQGGAFGIIQGSDLQFPNIEKLTGEDDYICLLNAYYNRKMWIDKRFYFQFNDKNYNIGGCEEFRNDETTKESFMFLKKNFGNAIVQDVNTKNILKWRGKIPF